MNLVIFVSIFKIVIFKKIPPFSACSELLLRPARFVYYAIYSCGKSCSEWGKYSPSAFIRGVYMIEVIQLFINSQDIKKCFQLILKVPIKRNFFFEPMLTYQVLNKNCSIWVASVLSLTFFPSLKIVFRGSKVVPFRARPKHSCQVTMT